MRGLSVRFLYLFIAASLLIAAVSRVDDLSARRREYRLTSRTTLEGVPPAYALADGLLGGFRGFLISTLWQRAQDKKSKRQFYEMVDIYKIISTLEPNYPNAWANMAWDLSYNVAAEFEENPQERVYWIFRGVAMLRDEAIRHNPRSALLYEQLAWIYFNKMANSVDPAFPLYRRTLALTIMRILDSGGETELLENIQDARKRYGDLRDYSARAETQKLIAAATAAGITDLADQAYLLMRDRPQKFAALWQPPENRSILRNIALLTMANDLQTRLNMDSALMLELSKRFPGIDWRMPQAHALYWSWRGREEMLAANPEYKNLKFERMIYFSLIQLAHNGSGIVTENGMVIATPNPPMVDGIIKYMEDFIAGRKEDTTITGVRSGFEYFMVTTVFNYYFADNVLQAEKVRQKLLAFTKNTKKYGKSLTNFINHELPEFISGLTEQETTMLLYAFCGRAYRHLMNGNPARFHEEMAWFDKNYLKLYNDWKQRFQGTFNWHQQQGMLSADEFKIQIAAQILSGKTNEPAQRIAVFRAGMKKYLPKILAQAEKIAAPAKVPATPSPSRPRP